MKIQMTKKEAKSYITMALDIFGGDKDACKDISNAVIDLVGDGVKKGTIALRINEKGELVYDIEEEYVTEIMSIFGGYVKVILPQIKSIIDLSKKLSIDVENANLKWVNK